MNFQKLVFILISANCINASANDVECSKVNYNNMESPATVLRAKKKSNEQLDVKLLRKYQTLFNKICTETKCIMERKKIDFKTFEKEYVDSIEWVKTPLQRKMQFNFIKELELESCVK